MGILHGHVVKRSNGGSLGRRVHAFSAGLLEHGGSVAELVAERKQHAAEQEQWRASYTPAFPAAMDADDVVTALIDRVVHRKQGMRAVHLPLSLPVIERVTRQGAYLVRVQFTSDWGLTGHRHYPVAALKPILARVDANATRLFRGADVGIDADEDEVWNC